MFNTFAGYVEVVKLEAAYSEAFGIVMDIELDESDDSFDDQTDYEKLARIMQYLWNMRNVYQQIAGMLNDQYL